MTITEDRTIIGRGGVDTLLERSEKESLIDAALEAWGGEPRRVLLVGPDMTRFHSGAGELAEIFYQRLTPRAQVDLIPALGSHVPMTPQELETMYPGIPASAVKIHNWRTTVRKLGEVPAEYIEDLSEGKLHYSIDVEVNTQLLDGEYDLILSLGQVVPHEVVGMANHVKNIMVGLGGKDILDKTHFLGAVHGMERMMGRIDTPVRRALDYAAASTLSHMPIKYALTVVAPDAQGDPVTRGLFIGDGRAPYLQAARLSQQLNITSLAQPIRKAMVNLDPAEFKSLWLGNKAVYRLRMAMADEGELIILGPGLKMFGEDPGVDQLIRKYGYRGTPTTLAQVEKNEDLCGSLSVAAHLIHGSSEGRFRITCAPGHLSREEIESVGFTYGDLEALTAHYNPSQLKDGMNKIEGEEVFFVSNPALGLWKFDPTAKS